MGVRSSRSFQIPEICSARTLTCQGLNYCSTYYPRKVQAGAIELKMQKRNPINDEQWNSRPKIWYPGQTLRNVSKEPNSLAKTSLRTAEPGKRSKLSQPGTVRCLGNRWRLGEGTCVRGWSNFISLLLQNREVHIYNKWCKPNPSLSPRRIEKARKGCPLGASSPLKSPFRDHFGCSLPIVHTRASVQSILGRHVNELGCLLIAKKEKLHAPGQPRNLLPSPRIKKHPSFETSMVFPTRVSPLVFSQEKESPRWWSSHV